MIMRSKIVPVILIMLSSLTCFGQRSATIPKVDFYLDQDRAAIIITYSIEKYQPYERFNVYPVIRKASGEKINANSFSGDISDVSGGPGKKIIWDLAKDNIILDEEIYVELTGERIVMSVVEKNTVTPGQLNLPGKDKGKESKSVKRTALFFESFVFPGWGTSRLTGKNGHFVKGALGYGTLIGSLLMAKKAGDNYDAYKRSSDAAERDELFNEASKNNTLAWVLGGSAAAIWSVDLVSVLAIRERSSAGSASLMKINVGYSLAAGNSHQLNCRINF